MALVRILFALVAVSLTSAVAAAAPAATAPVVPAAAPAVAAVDRTVAVPAPTASRGLDKLADGWPIVIVTPSSVLVQFGHVVKSIVAVRNGAVEPEDKEGGVLGSEIRMLITFVRALDAERKQSSGYYVIVDPTTPYGLTLEVLFSLRKAGVARFALVCKSATDLGALPIALPEPRAKPGAASHAIRPVVALTRDKLLLFSLSGSEGTLAKPALVVARSELAKLTGQLAAMVKRRFADGKRGAADRAIVFLTVPELSMADLVDAIVAARTTAEGDELFPDVILGSAE